MSTTALHSRRRPSRIVRSLVVIASLLGMFATSVSAQILLSPIRRWQHTYGNSWMIERTDLAPDHWQAKCSHPLERTKDGGYVMVGHWNEYLSAEVLTMRATITGSLVGPARKYGPAYSAGTQGTDIHQTSDGGFVILGNLNIQIPVGESFPGDFMVIKTDGAGSVIWQKMYTGANGNGGCREQAYSITQTKDGGYMVAGYVECPPGPIIGVNDILLMKLNADGSIAWHKEYNDYHWNYVAHSVQQTSDQGYVIAGMFVKSGAGNQAFMMKVKNDGTFEWFREFGGAATNDAFYSVAIGADGNYVASGKLGDDIYVVKVLSNGNFVWGKSFAGPEGKLDIGYDVKRSGPDYVVAGVVNNARAFLLRLRNDGSTHFSKSYAPPGATSVARSVVVTDHGYALGGDVSSGNSDLYIVKTNSDGDSFCNTENLTLSAATQGDGAWITMSTPSHTFEASPIFDQDVYGPGEAQLCYKEDQINISDAIMHDKMHVSDFNIGVAVDDNGGINDPVSEPVVLDAHAWTSEGIWVRTTRDAALTNRANGSLYEHELMHESPNFDLGTNYIYALITNAGDQATTPGTLNVYWSVSSTNIAWPTHWEEYTNGEGTIHGDLAGTAQIPSIGPGESYVAEIPWSTPDPGEFGGATPSVSFLARYVSATDPMHVAEGTNTASNAINNNNIVWRNEIIVSSDDMEAGQAAGTKTFVIRNTGDEETAADISLSIPAAENGINPLFDQGGVYVDLGTALYEQWVEAGRPGSNIQERADGTIEITGDNAVIGLTLPASSEETIGIRFENDGGLLPYKEYYHYDVVQAGGVGGVTFELRFPAQNLLPKVAIPGSEQENELAGGLLAARPNPATTATVLTYRVPVLTSARLAIYDVSGNLVRVLVPNQEVPAGTYSVQWDGVDNTGTEVSSGMYICRLETPLGVISRQVTILR